MRIEPVYLVAPVEEPVPSTRRGFLWCSAALVAGLVAGGAGGFVVGARSPAVELPPDEELETLLWLAKEASAEQLLAQAMYFLHTYSWKYREESRLFPGVLRVAEEVVRARNANLAPVARFAEEVLRSVRQVDPEEVDRVLKDLSLVR